MFNKLLNHRLSSLIILIKRPINIQSDFDLTSQMKLLNDKKQFQKTLQLFDQRKDQNLDTCSSSIITLALKACTAIGDPKRGFKIHQHLPSCRIQNDLYILNSLIQFYMQYGRVKDAQSLFDQATKKSSPMYGAMMNGYIQNKLANQAIELFHQVQNPDEVLLVLLFKACAQLETKEALDLTKQVAAQIPKSFHSHDRLLTSLLDALMKCGDVTYAELLFDRSTKKSVGMYGAMMKGYIKNNLANKAIEHFHQIQNPDEVIILLLFNACAQLETKEALDLTKQVAAQIPKSFHSHDRLLASLLDALMKCGDVTYAELLFNKSTKKSVGMYGAMMKGYIKNNSANKAIELFHQIQNPNEVIIVLFLNACAQLETEEALDLIKRVAAQIPKSFHSHDRLLASLLDALMKCGDVTYAELLFNKSTKKSVGMYGAMMKGYIKNNLANKAIEHFHQIQNPDEVIILLLFNACAQLETKEALDLTKQVAAQIPKSFHSHDRLLNSLLDALMKCGDVTYAELLFNKSTKKSIVMYTAMMSAFNKENNPWKTLNLFNQMKIDGIEANLIIYLCVIKALSKLGDYSLSQSFIENIPNHFLVDDRIQTALIDMWGKTGYVDRAKEIFQKMPQPNQITHAAMINSYGLNGMGIQSIEIYRQMPSEFTNETTHVCVLNACSHAGLVDEARSIFENIQIKTLKIYTSMIDCLSRASFFEKAQQLIDEFERCHSPALPMYMALLSGARNEMNSRLSKEIFDRMKNLFPESTNPLISASILLANVYAATGDMEAASNIRMQLHKSGAKKKVGLSWTIVNGQFFQFKAHDQSHPRSSEIYHELDHMSKQLVEHGHEYDSSWITRPLGGDETVASVLCGHSERIAIAWNFVANPHVSRIQVVKNLRVCGDCHRATKLIAAIRQCEIIVRDANRIHHFYTNGQCSCNDYF